MNTWPPKLPGFGRWVRNSAPGAPAAPTSTRPDASLGPRTDILALQSCTLAIGITFSWRQVTEEDQRPRGKVWTVGDSPFERPVPEDEADRDHPGKEHRVEEGRDRG